ncbi:MAG: T9SS type A sorting domain-containing protein [Ignavibacteriaceae bacterium]|nr:T9SS type A sorting domain-containing protein [Ignavibacteriaceae bacterium]
MSIVIDGSGNNWICTGNGLAKFDGANWTVYNKTNSGLPDNDVSSIAIDGGGNKWIGTLGYGLVKYDGTNWTLYDTSNSGLPDNWVNSLAIDSSGDKWVGTWFGGLAKFDGSNWTVYNKTNSHFLDYAIACIAIEGNGNKWIGTGSGLAVFREGGVILSENNKIAATPKDYLLYQNYPNPFNPTTTIKYSIPNFVKTGHAPSLQTSLKIYDVLGIEIATLVSEEKAPGENEVVFDAQGLASGIYFYQLRVNNFTTTKKMILLR